MRKPVAASSSSFRWRSLVLHTHRLLVRRSPASFRQTLFRRTLAQVRPEPWSELWFTASLPGRSPADELLRQAGSGNDHKPPDERTIKLGKSTSTSCYVLRVY